MDERFSKAVAEVLAKRAAATCSNPDCGALTSGPAEDEARSVNVGEAAHVYGAMPGSARYDPEMSPGQRGDITNGIWLCRNCHKHVDADATQFPAGLLFEWRREHEKSVADNIGKAGAPARERFRSRQLEEFRDCSYLAQQIILDRPDHWEYKLTTELLRTMVEPVLARWSYLKRGLYTGQSNIIPPDQILAWHGALIAEMLRFSAATNGLVNEVFKEAWGAPGVAGSDRDILRACGLFRELCEQLLLWEEKLRFVAVPPSFREVQEHMTGTAGRMLDELAKLPKGMTDLFSGEPKTGLYKVDLVFDLPDGWADRHSRLLSRAVRALN